MQADPIVSSSVRDFCSWCLYTVAVQLISMPASCAWPCFTQIIVRRSRLLSSLKLTLLTLTQTPLEQGSPGMSLLWQVHREILWATAAAQLSSIFGKRSTLA